MQGTKFLHFLKCYSQISHQQQKTTTKNKQITKQQNKNPKPRPIRYGPPNFPVLSSTALENLKLGLHIRAELDTCQLGPPALGACKNRTTPSEKIPAAACSAISKSEGCCCSASADASYASGLLYMELASSGSSHCQPKL